MCVRVHAPTIAYEPLHWLFVSPSIFCFILVYYLFEIKSASAPRLASNACLSFPVQRSQA